MDNKELIWVDKDLAEMYKKLDSDIEKANLVNKIIGDRKVDITSDIENLNDDLLRFKAFALNYSTQFKKAYGEQAEKIEELWENCIEPIAKIQAQTRKIKEEISSISNDIKDVNDKLLNLNTYKIERLIELIGTYNRMSDDDKEILKLILNK